MEPLADRLRDRAVPAATVTLGVLFVVALVFPFVAFLKNGFVAGGATVSALFAQLLLRSLGFTFVQSAMSALATLVVALPLGFLLASAEGPFARRLRRFADAAGSLVFALPGVLVSLVVLSLLSTFPSWPQAGLAPIVFAHVLIYVLFVASSVGKSLRAFLLAEGAQLLSAATSLGAPPLPSRWVVFRNFFAHELRTWAPLVFLGCFGAFSTVVILGGGPQASSPEVLLYFALQTDPEAGRVFWLVVSQLVVAWVLSRLARRSRSDESALLEVGDRDHSAQPVGLRTPAAATLPIIVLVLAAFAPLWLSPFRLMTVGREAPEGFWPATLLSLLLSLATTALALSFFELLLRSGSKVRRFTFVLSGVSSTLLAALWIAAGYDIPLESVGAQAAASALGLAFSFAPFMAYWIDRELARISALPLEAAAVLGAPDSGIFSRILSPQFSGLRFRVASLAALGAVGDLSFSTLFLRDAETLATLSRRLASRYDFTGSAWILLALFAVCAMTVAAGSLKKERA